MDFTIQAYERYNAHEILHLYSSVGWINYVNQPVMLENAYQNSLKVFGAYVGDTLAGIIRVVGDGYSIIYIQDIVVLPEYQHKGLGKALMNQVLETYREVYQKILITDNTEKNIRFYQSVGFQTEAQYGCRAFLKMY